MVSLELRCSYFSCISSEIKDKTFFLFFFSQFIINCSVPKKKKTNDDEYSLGLLVMFAFHLQEMSLGEMNEREADNWRPAALDGGPTVE